MYELLYTSVCPNGLSESELSSILKLARTKNASLGITGMLVYHDREVMQILEGNESDVKKLFQTILNDDRHTSVRVFYQDVIKERAFAEWSMAFKALDDKTIADLTEGHEDFKKGMSPISMVNDNPNRGRKIFKTLLNSL